MRITLYHPAAYGETFTADAFDHQLDTTIPLSTPYGDITCTLVATEPGPHGKSVSLTFDVDDDTMRALAAANDIEPLDVARAVTGALSASYSQS